jgi:hypothetical protein
VLVDLPEITALVGRIGEDSTIARCSSPCSRRQWRTSTAVLASLVDRIEALA